MKNKLILCLISIVVMLMSFGCSNANSKNIDRALIFKMNSTTWEKENDTPILEIKDKKGLELFDNLINNANKIEGVLDIAAPSYIIEVNKENDVEVLFLNIDNESGMYLNKKDNHIGYNLNKNDVKVFFETYIKSLD